MASFVKKDILDEALETIAERANIAKDQIFIFKSDATEDYILTYNVMTNGKRLKFSSIWPDTISIHRKKETNTLFSLNALNEIVKENNGGQVSSAYEVEWDEYRNSMLLFRSGELVVMPIELLKLNR